jgi:hypothetical protein
MFGYTQILHVNASTRRTWVEEKSPEFLKRYIGGIGLATRLLYDNTPAGAEPLGPENALCFACGSFAGTTVPVGTNHGVDFKSPLTGFIGDSRSGSHFSEMIRAPVGRHRHPGCSPDWAVLWSDVVDVQYSTLRHNGHGHHRELEAIRVAMGDENFRVISIGWPAES